MIIKLDAYRSEKERAQMRATPVCPISIRISAFCLDCGFCLLFIACANWWMFHYCQNICFPGISLFFAIGIPLLYFSMESKGNTIGKAFFGIRVRTISGGRISQKTAILRASLVGLGLLGAGIPFLFAGQPEKRRAFQDIWTRTSTHWDPFFKVPPGPKRTNQKAAPLCTLKKRTKSTPAF